MKTLKKHTIEEAAKKWIREFSHVPNSIIKKLAKCDKAVSNYDSDSFRLIASPLAECSACCAYHEGDLSLAELQEASKKGKGIPCDCCEADEWQIGKPGLAFSWGWRGTLFAPKEPLDIDWILDHQDEVAKL